MNGNVYGMYMCLSICILADGMEQLYNSTHHNGLRTVVDSIENNFEICMALNSLQLCYPINDGAHKWLNEHKEPNSQHATKKNIKKMEMEM